MGSICQTTFCRAKAGNEDTWAGIRIKLLSMASSHKNMDNGNVSFLYKDYADKGAQKLMILNAEEFLRRFCMHILPQRFRKIRHYGFLSNRSKQLLKMYQMQMGMVVKPQENKDWKLITKEKLHFDVDECPCCKTGKMVTVLCFNAHMHRMALWYSGKNK